MDIKRLFNEDIRDKKTTARGVHNRTGTRGYVGKMKFPSDFLKGKEKKAYKGAGKVKTYSMYDNIIDYTSFLSLSEEEQYKYLTNYRERFSNKEIMDKWGIGNNTYYRLTDKLGVKKLRRGKRKGSTKAKSTVKETKSYDTSELPTPEEVKGKEVVLKEKSNGMTLAVNGVYSAEEIVRRIEKFGIILSDESSKFRISLTISELE